MLHCGEQRKPLQANKWRYSASSGRWAVILSVNLKDLNCYLFIDSDFFRSNFLEKRDFSG